MRDISIGLLAAVLRSRPARGEKDRVQQPARLLHPRAQGRRCARSIPIRNSWPARATPSSAPSADRRHRTVSDQGRALLAARGSARRSRTGRAHRNGRYVTLRLTSSMYHRFHAPHDCRIEQVTYISRRYLERQSDRAASGSSGCSARTSARCCETRLDATGEALTLVPVAAMLVASIRLHFLDHAAMRRARRPDRLRRAMPAFRKGDETGLVRARLDHRDVCAGRIQPVRPRPGGRHHSHGSAAAAAAVSQGLGVPELSWHGSPMTARCRPCLRPG